MSCSSSRRLAWTSPWSTSPPALSLGAIVSPVHPLSTAADVARVVGLCNPSIVFATADTAGMVPADRTKLAVILLDSSQFESLLHGPWPRILER
ncbi:hypothetical protein BAE44_0000243 [Dichanthelium oligosanthes]|uniref:Uncharacterized protein n=1 Tax=Dichanthelium oligosanthes TaxID=888268 RepID=A0A1E5WMX7_9POAL|nr:hypothetical protein BAE44_0000243 [Dichanthelium oligosanthes]